VKASRRPTTCIVLFILALTMAAPVDAAERNLEAQTARLLRSYDQPSVPGCAVGVFQNGQTLSSRGFGMADVEASFADVGMTGSIRNLNGSLWTSQGCAVETLGARLCHSHLWTTGQFASQRPPAGKLPAPASRSAWA
jgi:hypothetical protein